MKREYMDAFRSYCSKEQDIEIKILDALKQVIYDNKETLENLIKASNEAKEIYNQDNSAFPIFNPNDEGIDYDEICNTIEKLLEKKVVYKQANEMIVNKDNFALTKTFMPIGSVAVIAADDKTKLKYMLSAITTHNVVDIIDPYYNEYSVISFVIELLKNVLESFEIDKKLVNYIPYEEYIENSYQKTLIYCDEQFNKLENHIEKDNVNSKDFLIYIQDEEFKSEIKDIKDIDVVYEPNYENAIEVINKNKYRAVSIYTKSSEFARLAMNEIYSENIYINTNIHNIVITDEIYKDNDKNVVTLILDDNINTKDTETLLINKKVIYPIKNNRILNMTIIQEDTQSIKNSNGVIELSRTKESSNWLTKLNRVLKKILQGDNNEN